MSIEIIVGINWGDEGKGRMVDYLAQNADVVVRYQGGNNAGHTVVNERGTFKLHLIPSGVFNPAVTNVLGPGTVIDIEALAREIQDLQGRGISPVNLKVSDRATICFPFHWHEDAWEEERLERGGQLPFGSTKRGIAPAYGDRAVKKAIQVGELLHPVWLKERLRQVVEWKNLIARGVYGKEHGVSFEETWDWVNTFGNRIKHMICDTTVLLDEAARQNKRILFEAQLGSLRDVYFGIYPYTTSSSALAAFAPIGGGLFGAAPDRVLGVMKAFATCVGEGPFVTEILQSEVANELREVAEEYGASTGRPRRIGHFDALASRYGAYVQGATEIALTKLDSLSGRKTLLICTHYEIDGKASLADDLSEASLPSSRPERELASLAEGLSEARHDSGVDLRNSQTEKQRWSAGYQDSDSGVGRLNSKAIKEFPINAVLEQCRPVYQEMEGWQEDISHIRNFSELPKAAQAYVLEIERLIARPIRYVSVGAARDCLIDRGTL